jgi:hypothetical protein
MMKRLASVLGVPLPYFYAEDDLLADMILAFNRMSRRRQQALLRGFGEAAHEP